MKGKSMLLPGTFRFAGILFFVAGVFLGIIRFYFGIKPEVFDLKPFAFYSSYVENKYMQFVGNNMSEEVVGLLILLGLFMIAFARDKKETEIKDHLRVKALYLTIYIQTIFLVVSFLFTFGFAFVYMLIINIAFPFIVFIITFRIMVMLNQRRNKSNELYF
jgi:hypothetical protein